MTDRGGAEGYVFRATRVLPAEGRVEARGKNKRRRTGRDEGDVDRAESKEYDGAVKTESRDLDGISKAGMVEE